MEYETTIRLNDGRECRLRHGVESDAASALANFILTHEQTDFLRSYPDENQTTLEGEAEYLRGKRTNAREVELVAEIEGDIVGLAGIEALGDGVKLSRRATFGVSVDRNFWGLGVGRALTRACVACAKLAGYAQLELEVVAENERATSLYLSEGFVEYGRNPRGFWSRFSGWQTLTLMRLELD